MWNRHTIFTALPPISTTTNTLATVTVAATIAILFAAVEFASCPIIGAVTGTLTVQAGASLVAIHAALNHITSLSSKTMLTAAYAHGAAAVTATIVDAGATEALLVLQLGDVGACCSGGHVKKGGGWMKVVIETIHKS